MLDWGSDTSYLMNKGQVALAREGSFIRVPTNYHNILQKLIDNKIDKECIEDCFVDQEDKKTMVELVQSLIDIGVVIEKSDALIDEEYQAIDQLTILITNKCNLTCIHCSQNADNADCERNEMSYTEICKVIDQITVVKVKEIVISGGEPLTRKDFFEIIEYLRSKFNGTLTLMTNSLLFSENNVDQIIKNFNHLSISLDGVDEELTTKIRGSHVYQRVIQNIELLHQHNFYSIDLSAILPNSTAVRDKYYELCKQLQVEAIPRDLSYIGRAENNGNTIDKIFEEYIASHNYDTYDQIAVQYIGNLNKCGACNGNLTIDSYGNVFPCNLLQYEKYSLGNVLTDENILTSYNRVNNYKAVKQLKEMNLEPCLKCELKKLCWFCIADYEVLIENKEKFIERCRKRKNTIYSYYFGEAYEC